MWYRADLTAIKSIKRPADESPIARNAMSLAVFGLGSFVGESDMQFVLFWFTYFT